MNPQEIIEAIKTIIKMQAQSLSEISHPFFEEKRADILHILKLMQSAINDIDEKTLNSYYDKAVKEYISVYPIVIDPSSSLTNEGFTSWLTDERKKYLEKNNHYIKRYLSYLRKEGRSDSIVEEISRSSESILGKLGDPQSSSAFYTKGLVVGSVQSGKTGNFNAVINRSIDAGYNLVIILSGIMEDLRSQTQLRLELDVIGDGFIPQTQLFGKKGVGNITGFGVQSNSEIPQVFSITSHKSDFKTTLLEAGFSLNNKNILVCKKNTGVLKNLLIWLSDYLSENKDQHDIPLLIVDDEADNASLNNLGHKGREYSSTINGHIRSILALFSRKTYLGYTATPFANVLQDRNEEAQGQWSINFKRNGESCQKRFNQVDNIFPDDFIELLNPPSNYIGAKQIFETTIEQNIIKIPLIEPIEDHLESFPLKLVVTPGEVVRPATIEEIKENELELRSPKKDDQFPIFLPNSLKDAIECFVLSIAVRLKRRPSMIGSKLYNPHNTMLIHISRFIEWQNRTRSLVQNEIENLTKGINNDFPSEPNSIYLKLETTWNKYYAAIVANIKSFLPDGYTDEFLDAVDFNDIKSLLPEAIKGLEVKAINSILKEKLTYTTDSSGIGKKYIAIGGNRLSRGFTLEGLTINYFLRDTNFADTLLQMGRWFGYRPGYIDCCKLFTTWDAIEKFDATTRTIEELEVEFKKMARQKPPKTPKDFILRVRTHPGVLKITRPSILKNTEEVNWSYQDTLVQTTQFNINSEKLTNAWTGITELFSVFEWSDFQNGGFLVTETNVTGLFRFLDCPNTFHEYDTEIAQIKTFIKLCIDKGKLINWRIAIKAKGNGGEIESNQVNLPRKIEMSVRSGPSEKVSQAHYRKQLLDKNIFTGSGKSANILSAGLDMSLWLDENEILEAEKNFIETKTKEFQDNNIELAKEKASKLTKPERIYRERMSEKTGLLIIYLIDLNYVFKQTDNALNDYKERNNIDTSIPLIGYAIGFPPIDGNIGGVYLRGKYNIEEDEPQSEEYDEEILNSMEETI